ncbi:hypothetical protein AVEN_146443-1 [Araneus ventricosus]|uniref:Uncharacterized protein n=1 Tax=Araneus ventricosus TaxID=182803 RepID=A0A4Y2V1M4_ARAVE|nr:hypothetical protein AVEN_146443-1 [Araneus ventricosus]
MCQILCVLEISFPILHVIKSPDDETAINLTSVYEWHWRFEKGRQSIDDDEMSGWPPISIKVEQISIFKKTVECAVEYLLPRLQNHVDEATRSLEGRVAPSRYAPAQRSPMVTNYFQNIIFRYFNY